LSSTQIQKDVPQGYGRTHVVYPPAKLVPTWLWNVHMQIVERGHASCGTYALRLLALSEITRHNSLPASVVADSPSVGRLLYEMTMKSYPSPLHMPDQKYIALMSCWPPGEVGYSPRLKAT